MPKRSYIFIIRKSPTKKTYLSFLQCQTSRCKNPISETYLQTGAAMSKKRLFLSFNKYILSPSHIQTDGQVEDGHKNMRN